MRIIISCISLLLISFISYSQRWQRARYEVLAGTGSSFYLGEMVSSKSLPLLYAGARYKIRERHALSFSFNYSRMSATDLSSKDIDSKNRNLHFISDIMEGSVQYEFSVIKEMLSARYTFRNMQDFRLKYVNTYIFAGIGRFSFNPKARAADGKYYELQPLGTEGQGIDGNPGKYDRVGIAIPVGIGFKYGIDRRSAINIEISYRFTNTDYVDDVSGSYYDKNEIELVNGEIASELSDRRIHADNNLRGNPENNDSYFFFKVGIVYKLKTSRSGMPRLW